MHPVKEISFSQEKTFVPFWRLQHIDINGVAGFCPGGRHSRQGFLIFTRRLSPGKGKGSRCGTN
jgi:hypothetical protein